jgi:putative sigma-54 modulation protein
MKVQIHIKAVSDEADLRERAERRLRIGLGRFADELRSVRVILEDVNGPRQGIDKRCAVSVSGARVGRLFLEETDSLASRALDRLTDRLDRAIVRALDRGRVFAGSGPGRTGRAA